jgi:2-haloacid dehalogenase
MKYKWLLLDADGTLFDYDKAEAAALEKTFGQIGHKFESRYARVYRRINEQMWLDFEQGKISQARLRIKRFERFLEAVNVVSDPQSFSKKYLKNLADGSYLLEGAEEIVKSLYGKIGLVIITNGLKEVQRSRLAKSTIGEYFAAVVISGEAGAAKPAQKIFDVAFDKMGDPRKEEVLIVGDSLTSDIKGGSDYGIDTCWFNPGQKPCDLDVEIRYEIEHLSELLNIVETV